MRPWRVAYVEGAVEVGGAERVLLDLLERLPRDRVESLLLCPGEGELLRQARRRGIRCETYPCPAFRSTSSVWRGKRILNPVALAYDSAQVLVAARTLEAAVCTLGPDLIQTNSMMAHFYGSIAARRLGVPSVWHMHDVVEETRLGGLGRLFWRHLALRLPSRIVGVSRYSVRAFGEAAKVETVYSGVAVRQPKATSNWRMILGLGPDTILIGFVGRIARVKGLETLVRAAEIVCREDARVHFVLVGASLFGEDYYCSQLVALIKALNLVTRIHLVGYYPDAADRLADFHCLVLPSRREALGQVVLEAGLAGKPVVATEVGGIPEIVVDGVTGLLVQPGEPGSLADAILRLVRHPELAAKFGVAARRLVEERFSLEPSIARWLAIYCLLLPQCGHK